MELSTEFTRTVYDNLRLKSKILAFVIGAVVVLQVIGIIFVYQKGLLQKYNITSIAFFGPCIITVACISEIYAYRFFKRKINELAPVSNWIIYGTTTIEVSFPTLILTFVLLLRANFPGVSANLIISSPPFIMYFIMIALSSLVMNVRLCFYSGMMAGLQYLALVIILAKVNMLNELDIPNAFSRAVFLVAFGIIIGFVSRKILESVRSSLESKNKLIHELDSMVREKTKEIHAQKEELAEKNKDITDSINYARNIQDSILPELDNIKALWPDIFIFYQPKDIVSGDFYWFHKTGETEFLLACCDCTGHGVPGAFMSMLCSSKLHEAALQSSEPDQVLFHANNRIKHHLGQQVNGKNKDGMEVCLVKIDTRSRTVKYAGANRPLWIYKNKTSHLEEVKPTKTSIASSTDFDSSYNMHTFKLEKGDILYATSDGYSDQFGGKSDKKYMAKNFKTFLAKKASLPMDEQLKEVRSNINNWMGQREQVDDLLVIGIKL
jgi:serine phosphatase RsbU (regulator of sigma subunit)